MKPEIVQVEGMTVVGLLTLTEMKNNLIPKLWQRYMEMNKETKNVSKENVWLGVSFGTKMLEDNDMEMFVLAGRPVSKVEDLPELYTWKEVEGGEYAKFVYKGKLEDLTSYYNDIFYKWFPESGYEYDCSRCDYEWYDERFKMDSDDSELDIYVPIKKK